MAEVTARNGKLIQYLSEAYGKERELETALEAHIAMTTRAPYKKRLQQHLRETKDHGRQLERRIKQLGGKDAVAEVTAAVQTAASKALSAAKGPLHALRGTSEPEKMLKNAKTEYSNEAEEIANYKAIETLADTVGDKDTVQLARGIRREEERMASFLERQIPSLTKAVAQEEIPASERRAGRSRSRRRTSGSSNGASASRSRSSSSSSRARSSNRGSSSKRSSSSRSGSRRTNTGSKRRTTSARSGSNRGGRSRSRSRSRS
jgi:ferritin-like metal-binding protein YciE